MRLLHKLAAALLTLGLVATGSFGGDEAAVQPQEQPAYPPSIQYEANISAGGIAPAGGSLRNPYKGNKEIAGSGAALFVSMNCDGCHGGGATGWVGPSLADGRWRYGGAENEIFESIYYGRPKGMPAFGGVLGSEGIWILVTYLQSLPVPENVPTQSWEK